MSNLALVQRVMDHITSEDLEAAFDLIDSEVTLQVLRAGGGPDTFEQHSGREAVQAYFAALGGIVTFWDLRLFEQGNRILVLGRERYTTTVGLESATELVVICKVRDGVIAETLVVEDLTLVLRGRNGTFLPSKTRRSGVKPMVYLAHRGPDLDRASA